MKRIISLLAAFLFSMLCMAMPVHADSDVENDYYYIGTGLIRGNDPPPPDNVWNLDTDGMYTLGGEAYGTADLYTEYRFTSSNLICASVRNLGTNYTITVTLRQFHSIFGFEYSLPVDSFTVSPGTREMESFNVSAYGQYFFSFSAPCIFDGYIA